MHELRKHSRLPSAIRRSRRTGVVLLIVLVVVAMLALGAYSFVQLMNMEARAAQAYGRQVQARAAADSGVQYAAAILMDQKLNGVLGTDLYDSSAMFHGQLCTDQSALHPRERSRFSIVAGADSFDSSTGIRFGLIDESAKINLSRALDLAKSQSNQAGSGAGGDGGTGTGGGPASGTSAGGTNPLLYLPNMTPEIADAILDWIDSDDEPRPYGAESDYYQSLNPPYRAKNGPINSLDDLLQVAGVTPRLLYGEDANHNGILDPNEDDGEQSAPSDDGNGELDRGWLPYLTIYSRESNSDYLGAPRINLNSNDLETLYDTLAADSDFGEERAKFIVAYRLFGVANQGGQSNQNQAQDTASQNQGGQNNQAGAGGAAPQSQNSSQGQGSQGGSGGQPSTTPEKTIAGMDATDGAQFEIKSVLDLIDATVALEVAGQQTPVNTKSPFTTDTMDEYLDTLLDRTTTTKDTESFGRINCNVAPREVLLALPGITEDIADAIVSGQPSSGTTSGNDWSTTDHGWLLVDGHVTKEQFKTFEQYITGRSQMFRIQVIGYFEDGGPVARLEAVIDVSGSSPRIRMWRDLTPLGRGVDPGVLMGTSGN